MATDKGVTAMDNDTSLTVILALITMTDCLATDSAGSNSPYKPAFIRFFFAL